MIPKSEKDPECILFYRTYITDFIKSNGKINTE